MQTVPPVFPHYVFAQTLIDFRFDLHMLLQFCLFLPKCDKQNISSIIFYGREKVFNVIT